MIGANIGRKPKKPKGGSGRLYRELSDAHKRFFISRGLYLSNFNTR